MIKQSARLNLSDFQLDCQRIDVAFQQSFERGFLKHIEIRLPIAGGFFLAKSRFVL